MSWACKYFIKLYDAVRWIGLFFLCAPRWVKADSSIGFIFLDGSNSKGFPETILNAGARWKKEPRKFQDKVAAIFML